MAISADEKVTLIVPCYNEEKRLDGDAFVAAVQRFPTLSLLFVNDGSRDATEEVLRALVAREPERLGMHSLEVNSGKCEAVRVGMQQAYNAGAALIGYWDADLATSFDEFPLFLDAVSSYPDIQGFLGSRVRMLGREIERHAMRHYLGRVVATCISGITGLRIYDSQCGAKVFRRSAALETALVEPFQSRWLFDVELLSRLCLHPDMQVYGGNLFRELPLGAWRDVAGSKISLKDSFPVFWDLCRIWRRYGGRRAT